MSDKSKNSHIERTVYVSPDTCPGDSIRYGDWRDSDALQTWYDRARETPGNYLGRYEAKGLPLTLIDRATGSDYSGNLCERSNATVLKEKFPWLVEIYGGHGTFGIAYLGKRENQNDELIECIDSLASDGGLLDSDHHSHLEMDAEREAWESDGRDDFKRALVRYFDVQYAPDEHDLVDDSHNDAVDAFWYACTERLQGGESFRNESGDSIYFPIDDVIEKIERSWPGMSRNGYDGSPSLDWMLVRLAEAALLSETPSLPQPNDASGV